MSIVTHMAVIGAVTVATARGTTRPTAPDKPTFVRITPPPPTPDVRRTTDPPARIQHASTFQPPTVNVIHVDPPQFVPKGLPPIDAGRAVSADSIVVGSRGASDHGNGAMTLDLGGTGHDDTEWRGADLLTRVIVTGTPRYPEALRQTGIEGHVLVRFTIDTLGRVDMSTVQVLGSTHDLFANAVRQALPNFRFKPAESRGRRVAMLAEMPFEFALKR